MLTDNTDFSHSGVLNDSSKVKDQLLSTTAGSDFLTIQTEIRT